MDFALVLRMLQEFFAANGTPYAVIGGVGLAAYGIGRTTLDVDIVVDSQIQGALIDYLENEGFETLYRSSGYSNHLHSEALLGRVDVVYVRGETSRQVFESRSVRPGPEGLEISVPRPEHLAAMKIFAMKNDPSRTLGELADIRMLMDLPDVDREAITSFFEKHGLEEALEQLEALE